MQMNKMALIPDASSSMMGHYLHTLRLHSFDGVIQKEIDEYGIDMHLWMIAENLAPDQLNAPDTAASQLYLPRMTTFYVLLLSDVRFQERRVRYAAK